MKSCLTFLATCLFLAQVSALEVTGLVQANLVAADELSSWQRNGTGILRYDQDQINLQQSVLVVTHDILSTLQLKSVANYYHDGQQKLGISQLELNYKPISPNKIRWQARAGFFYPKISFENVDIGWLSPYNYTQSAINSWIGEEQRTSGVELTLYSPGRVRKSPWSWQVRVAGFVGNDPLGSIISWRGFAMHDRQSLNNDRVEFAPYPTVIDRDALWHPSWVEPFHEIDGKAGFYLGTHLDYLNRSNFRYYYYDNLADPNQLNGQRLYAWRTKYHALSWQHKFSRQTRIISQIMSGSTEMGLKFVHADFDLIYLLVSHKFSANRLSLRVDRFMVQEDDIMPQDYNDSDGTGLTLTWRYDLDNNWQLGLEQHVNRNTARSRASLGLPSRADQQQTLAVLQYRF